MCFNVKLKEGKAQRKKKTSQKVFTPKVLCE